MFTLQNPRRLLMSLFPFRSHLLDSQDQQSDVDLTTFSARPDSNEIPTNANVITHALML